MTFISAMFKPLYLACLLTHRVPLLQPDTSLSRSAGLNELCALGEAMSWGEGGKVLEMSGF
jgi:hypothetical protein